MGFEMTKIGKADAVEFGDTWGDRITVQYEPEASVEISWSNRDMRNIILDRDMAATLGRILLAHARDGDLSGAEAAIAGTDAKPADADPDRFDAIERRLKVMESLANVASNAASRMDDIERRLDEAEDAQAQQAGWLGEHRQRLDAVEEKIAASADGTVKVPVTVVKTWTPKVGDRVIDKGEPEPFAGVGEGRITETITGHDGRTRYIVTIPDASRACLPEHLEPAPPRDRTPQDLADEMSERFPVGTKVSYRISRDGRLFHDGKLASPFLVRPVDGELVAVVTDDEGDVYLAIGVEPRG